MAKNKTAYKHLYFRLLYLIKQQEAFIYTETQEAIIDKYGAILHAVNTQPDLTQGCIGRMFGMDKAAVARIINTLENEKWVKRVTHATDRRCHIVKPTAKTMKWKQYLQQQFTALDEMMFEGIPSTELNTFNKVLSRITNNINNHINTINHE